jgi:mycothiol system anti-sigma-R factor
MIECSEAVRRLWDYLENVLEPVPTQELETHLDACTRCCGELEFNRHIRQMVAERHSVPLAPPALRERVEQLLIVTEPEGEVAK